MANQAGPSNFKAENINDNANPIVKAWHGRPSILCFLPKALYYLALIIAIFFVNNKFIYPTDIYYDTAFEFQKYMLFNLANVFHNADSMGWRAWYLLGALAVTGLLCCKIIIGFLKFKRTPTAKLPTNSH